MIHPVAFSLTYLVSWLLMGLGVFLTFRFVTHLRQTARAKVEGKVGGPVMMATPVTIALVVLAVLAGVGVFYSGAYTLYNLVIAP